MAHGSWRSATVRHCPNESHRMVPVVPTDLRCCEKVKKKILKKKSNQKHLASFRNVFCELIRLLPKTMNFIENDLI